MCYEFRSICNSLTDDGPFRLKIRILLLLVVLLLFNNPCKGKRFLSSPTRPDRSWGHPSPVQ